MSKPKPSTKAFKTSAQTGRPRKSGERYPSGQLKPPKPNEIVMERRRAVCADPALATCPLDAAYGNGWLSRREWAAGRAYIVLNARADLGGPGSRSCRDTSLPTGAALDLSDRWSDLSDRDVRRLRISLLPDKQIVAIWDSALRDLGRMADPEKAEIFAAEANRRWKAMNRVMTAIERNIVDRVCIREVWPRWFHERLAGNMTSQHEDERDILVSGLKAMAGAYEQPRTPAVRDLLEPRKASGPRRFEHVRYEDEEGNLLFEAERVLRRSA